MNDTQADRAEAQLRAGVDGRLSAPHHDPVVIGRSQTGDHCQITLERWLPIDGEPALRMP
jgi:hypothetical protein